MGGLTTAAKLVEKGAKVVVLEKYLLPGGSAAHYKREGYTFDVGSSMMFGFGDEGTTNLITKALEAVGKKMQTLPDPTQVHYHLPASAAHPDVSAVGAGWGGGQWTQLLCVGRVGAQVRGTACSCGRRASFWQAAGGSVP